MERVVSLNQGILIKYPFSKTFIIVYNTHVCGQPCYIYTWRVATQMVSLFQLKPILPIEVTETFMSGKSIKSIFHSVNLIIYRIPGR